MLLCVNSGTELYFVLDGEVEVESQGVRLGFLSEGTPHTLRLEFSAPLSRKRVVSLIQDLWKWYRYLRTHRNHATQGHYEELTVRTVLVLLIKI